MAFNSVSGFFLDGLTRIIFYEGLDRIRFSFFAFLNPGPGLDPPRAATLVQKSTKKALIIIIIISNSTPNANSQT